MKKHIPITFYIELSVMDLRIIYELLSVGEPTPEVIIKNGRAYRLEVK